MTIPAWRIPHDEESSAQLAEIVIFRIVAGAHQIDERMKHRGINYTQRTCEELIGFGVKRSREAHLRMHRDDPYRAIAMADDTLICFLVEIGLRWIGARIMFDMIEERDDHGEDTCIGETGDREIEIVVRRIARDITGRGVLPEAFTSNLGVLSAQRSS